ncbi:MAG: glycoside hydrolase family 15 [Nanoarchaeota archaeon]|nr:glycoside hydrolase family 15 [Nanoarchaeota archaeon]MBU1321502.1 glycoside hydrolase family 15 [Nanoarchaeota archaeon]MBU1597395.1 glycoside hydrolase family 15 [Nanoarchaeota archaeon]MBU2441248.1 glycoside hydrolase family 15 [Nanoarchaeota archaeon]
MVRKILKKITNKHLIKQHLEILKGLQYKTGLFGASAKAVKTGYNKAWLRDNFYECLAFFVLKDYATCKETYKTFLRVFEKHEYKIDRAIEKKPENKHEYIHARYHPHTFDEFWEDWGNKQNDAVGAILWGIASLEDEGIKIMETEKDKELVQKLVHYLNSIEYWHDQDSGMWENEEETHASSIGACLAGLIKIRRYVNVPDHMIEQGRKSLNHLLPRESEKKYVDLAELSLIYPYDIVTKEQRDKILENVEYHLLKERGVIRYKNDWYYNKNPDGYSEEAEWCFGLSWLAIIYDILGNKQKAEEFLQRAIAVDTKKGMPELYYSNSPNYNENTPLGWSESMFIIALHEFNNEHYPMPLIKK